MSRHARRFLRALGETMKDQPVSYFWGFDPTGKRVKPCDGPEVDHAEALKVMESCANRSYIVPRSLFLFAHYGEGEPRWQELVLLKRFELEIAVNYRITRTEDFT